MYCNHCGKPVATGARFCAHCGASTDPAATQPAPAPARVSQQPGEKYRPVQELKRLFTWKVSPRQLYTGRLNRRDWLVGVILSSVMLALLWAVLFVLTTVLTIVFPDGSDFIELAVGALGFYGYAVYVVFLYSLHARRFHDRGISGWASLLALVPVVNLGVLLYLLFARGQDTANQYGEKPAKDELGVWALAAIVLIILFLFGLLTSLVLVALGSARDKANDARIRSDIGQLRTLAEIYYDVNDSSYVGYDNCVATASPADCGDSEVATSIAELKTDIAEAGGALEVASAAADYCISSPLRSDPASYSCADVTGRLDDLASAGCGSNTSCR